MVSWRTGGDCSSGGRSPVGGASSEACGSVEDVVAQEVSSVVVDEEVVVVAFVVGVERPRCWELDLDPGSALDLDLVGAFVRSVIGLA